MPQYTVGKQWFFPQIGVTANPGEVIELDEGVADQYMHNEPGILKPVLHNTQAKVKITREKSSKVKRPRARS
jgi:hypothetical protein